MQNVLKQRDTYFYNVLNNAPFPIMIHSEDGKVQMINEVWTELTGYTQKDIPTTDIWTEKAYGEKKIIVKKEINALYNLESMKKENENSVKTRNGEILIWDFSSAPLGYFANELRSVISMAQDITERKQAETKIQQLLNEKEILLKEVHHRIKNNMSVIEGLLSMQSDRMEFPEAAAALKDAISRIESMRVLYDKLYRSENYSEILSMEYISNLVDEIFQIFPNTRNIKIEKHLDNFVIDAGTIFPLGIILNELLTNILKYAFKGQNTGLIIVTLKEDQGNVTLSIKDNGIGFPEGFDIETHKGFGLMLIKMLSEQLGGSFTIENDNGIKATLKFCI